MSRMKQGEGALRQAEAYPDFARRSQTGEGSSLSLQAFASLLGAAVIPG